MHERFEGVAGWLKNSFIDFPGTVAAVLFYSGCNMRCPFCHNPSLVNGDITLENYDEMESFFLRRKNVLDGVVLTGGEPTLWQSMPSLAHWLKREGYKIKLDTNGLTPRGIDECDPDYLAVDIKTSLAKYYHFCKIPVDKVENSLRETIEKVKRMKEKAEIRITVAPPLVALDDSDSIGELIRGVEKVYLQKVMIEKPVLDPHFCQYREEVDELYIAKLKKILETYVGAVIVR